MAQYSGSSFSFSFVALSKNRKRTLRQLSSSLRYKTEGIPGTTNAAPIDPIWLHANRDIISASQAQHCQQMQGLNPALFPFISAAQRKALHDHLTMVLWTSYLLLYLDTLEQRFYNYDSYGASMQHANDLLSQLEPWKKRALHPSPQASIKDSAGTATHYLGLPAAAVIQKIITELQRLTQEDKTCFEHLLRAWKQGKTKVIKDWLTELNGLRLYWVWGNSLLDTIFSIAHQFGRIDTPFFNELERKLQSPNFITGNAGWILYFTRFFINLGLLLKHVIPHYCMTSEERSIPWQQRLSHEWNKRKYELLNDSIWGATNYACYYFLSYRVNTRMGFYGDALTAVLLIMDLSLTLLRFTEEEKKHATHLKRLSAELKRMGDKIAREKNPDKKAELTEHYALLKERIEESEFDWYYQKLSLYNDLFYAAALLGAFCLLIGVITPQGALASSVLVLSGAIACFALTVLFNAVENTIPLLKTQATLQRVNNECQTLIDLLQQPCDDLKQQKALYIKLQDKNAAIASLQQNLTFQTLVGVRGLFIDTVTPIVVLAAILYLPTGLGIAALSAAFILAVASKYCVHCFEAPAVQPTSFSDKKFGLFMPTKLPTNTLESETQPGILGTA